MRLANRRLYIRAITFNLITFSGGYRDSLPPAGARERGEHEDSPSYSWKSRQSMGGTEMMKAIRAALDPSGDSGHVRVVCFMTDGYVGNDMEIIAESPEASGGPRILIRKSVSSVNRFLLDRMALEGPR